MGKIRFLPFEKEIDSYGKIDLLQLALMLKIPISSGCGGKGICGKCRVIIEEHSSPIPEPDEDEEKRLGTLIQKGYRLACQVTPSGDMTVRIPDSSISKNHAILTSHSGFKKKLKVNPPINSMIINRAELKKYPQQGDMERISNVLKYQYSIRSPVFDISVLRELPLILRDKTDTFTILIREKKEILEIHPGKNNEIYGMAIDLGTTTIVGYLMNLIEGKQISVRSSLNPQIRYGDDVISRIRFSQENERGLKELQGSVINKINEIIKVITESAGLSHSKIHEVAIVGNTAMHHILMGIRPDYISLAPYSPVLCSPMNIRAKELGIDIAGSGYVYLPPPKTGFFGSDAIASALASGMHRTSKLSLMLDIGTNGEIVLGNRERLLCCSTAAGPAMEGGHIKWGMRASEGAIEKVKIDPSTYKITIKTIMKRAPVGICGSGIVSLLAEMLRTGLLNPDGSFNTNLAPSKFRKGEDGMEFIICDSGDSSCGTDIVITRKDISQIQLTKSAIRAGTEVLMKMMNINLPDMIFLAGAGGTYIDPEDAIQIGLIPEIPISNIISMGNGAGLGACMMLTNIMKRKEAERISQKMEYVELAGLSLFEDLFIEYMHFPKT